MASGRSSNYVDYQALLHVSVNESESSHHSVVAARVITPIDVVPCEPLAVRSPSCSDPDLHLSDLDYGGWDASTVASVHDAALDHQLAEGMNPPSALFADKPNEPTESAATPTPVLLILQRAPPEILRSDVMYGDGSLVPDFGYTGLLAFHWFVSVIL